MVSNSLFTKLMLAFVLVALTGSILTALLANRIAASGLDLVTSQRSQTQARRLSSVMSQIYRLQGNWPDSVALLEELAESVAQPQDVQRRRRGHISSYCSPLAAGPAAPHCQWARNRGF